MKNDLLGVLVIALVMIGIFAVCLGMSVSGSYNQAEKDCIWVSEQLGYTAFMEDDGICLVNTEYGVQTLEMVLKER